MIKISPKFNFVYDGAMVNIYHANKGEGLPRHEHSYAHATFCVNGKCSVEKEHKKLVLDKNTKPINLKEKEWHEIEALEDDTIFINIFSQGKY